MLKQGLNCDCDRLHRLVNKEMDVQRFLGRSPGGVDGDYELQTIRDNVELMMPELLREVSQLVAATGHKVLGKKPTASVSDAIAIACRAYLAADTVEQAFQK